MVLSAGDNFGERWHHPA